MRDELSRNLYPKSLKKIFVCLFILAALGLSCGMRDLYLQHMDFLVVACGLLVAACMRDLVPQPGMEPRPPALGVRSLTHWTTREVPRNVS